MNPQSQIYSTVAPWPGQDDGDEGRQRRGMAIAALVPVEKNRLGYKVPSQSGNGSYVVNTDSDPFCTYPDFEKRQQPRILRIDSASRRKAVIRSFLAVPQPLAS